MPSPAEDFEPDPSPGVEFTPSGASLPDIGFRAVVPGTEREAKAAAEGQRDKPGEGTAVLRGMAQGVTLGFADELAGAVEAGLLGNRRAYTTARDESRQKFAESAEKHPLYYGAGLGGTAFIPMPGAAAASLGKTVLKSAALGGVAGLGSSEADLTKGEVGKAAVEAGVGAGTSAALSAVAGWRLRGAEKRTLQNLVEDVNRGETAAKKSGRVALARQAGGEEMTALRALQNRHPGPVQTLAVVARAKPERGAEIANSLIKKLALENAPAYQAINAQKGGVKLIDIVADVDKERRAFEAAMSMYEAKAVESARREIINTYGVDGRVPTDKRLPAEAVRKLASKAGQVAFAGDQAAPTSVKRAATGAIHDALVGTIEKSAAGVRGVDLYALRTNNKDMSILMTMRDNMAQRALDRQGGGQALTHILKALGGGALTAVSALAQGGGGLGTLAAGAGGAAAIEGGRRLLRASDRGGAALMRSARSGNDLAKAAQAAIEQGVPRVLGGAAAGAVSRATKIEPDDFEPD